MIIVIVLVGDRSAQRDRFLDGAMMHSSPLRSACSAMLPLPEQMKADRAALSYRKLRRLIAARQHFGIIVLICVDDRRKILTSFCARSIRRRTS
jgi:hypothetical protein